MTITFGEYTPAVTSVLLDDRAFIEVLVIVTLVAILLQREMLRHLPQLWARAGLRGLTAIAVPLIGAWLLITTERFLDLL